MPFKSRAQFAAGIETGLSDNYLNTNISNRSYTAIRSGAGFMAGIPLHWKLKSWLFAEAVPEMLRKNYTIHRTDSLVGIYESFTNTYIQLPLSVGVSYGKCLKVFGNAGVYMGYWLSGSVKGSIPDIFSSSTNTNTDGQSSESFKLVPYHQKYFFNPKRDNRVELGWMVGLGMQYQLNLRYSLFIKGSYYQSLTDQQKAYMVQQMPQHNQTIIFSIGGMIAFSNK